MSPRGTWLREGVDPLPPSSSDKSIDRTALSLAGGERLVIRDSHVLDIGPCYAIDARELAPLAKSYTIVDEDELVIEWARRFAPRARGVVADALELPFRQQSFQTVIDFGTFDNTGDPLGAYVEACRVLIPGGILITTYGNADLLRSDPPGEIYSRPADLVTLLTSCGCVIVARQDGPRAILVARRT